MLLRESREGWELECAEAQLFSYLLLSHAKLQRGVAFARFLFRQLTEILRLL